MSKVGTDIDRAAALILQGQLVAIPTETVYGLAANALDPGAVVAIYEAKQRPAFDPLIVHVPDIASVEKHAVIDDERLWRLAECFWPGPLTMLLPKRPHIPDIVTAGLPRVAVRIPSHPLTLALLHKAGVPLAAPSANPFGYISPTSAAHVLQQLGHAVVYVLDGGPSAIGLESTIISLEPSGIVVHRLGGLALEEIEDCAGPVRLSLNMSGDPLAPGQMKSHYAPLKPLLVGDVHALLRDQRHRTVSLIIFGNPPFLPDIPYIYNLSPSGDLQEAAINLFSMMRQADEDPSQVVIASYVPDQGLGRAINDRLRRASAR